MVALISSRLTNKSTHGLTPMCSEIKRNKNNAEIEQKLTAVVLNDKRTIAGADFGEFSYTPWPLIRSSAYSVSPV